MFTIIDRVSYPRKTGRPENLAEDMQSDMMKASIADIISKMKRVPNPLGSKVTITITGRNLRNLEFDILSDDPELIERLNDLD